MTLISPKMTKTTVENALSNVADILSSAAYSNKEVLILIPHILLADGASVEKVSIGCLTLSTKRKANAT
jgi:hypothetical protein